MCTRSPYRVPRSAYGATTSALDLSTIAGPVSTGWPPPRMSPLRLYSHSSSTAAATKVDYKDLFAKWMANAPAEWEFTPENQIGPVRGAALPMGFNRGPLYGRGLMLAGDSAGMVSPFNGEGIAYGLQAGRFAADAVVQASIGTIADRTRELLGPTDLGVVQFRRLMLEAASALQRGEAPAAAADPDAYRVRAGGIVLRDDADLQAAMTERFGDPIGRIAD